MKYGEKMKKFIKLFLILIVVFIVSNLGIYIYCFITPKINISRNQSYYLYDNNNNLIFNNYSWVSLEEISEDLINATLSSEDKNFYRHFGLDYFRILRALINNISSGSLSQGASTITQQYARNLYLGYEKTWKRKMEEALLAIELEVHYSKKEILEGYLNTINYGGVYGIENASKYYFNKKASDLNLAEASMLAGIPQSPMNNSPLYNEKKALTRQKVVLKLMKKNKYIDDDDINNALNTKLFYEQGKENNITSGMLYFKDSVLDELSTISYIPRSLLETGGIKIYTTMDIVAQEELEKAKNTYMHDSSDLQIGAVMLNPNNGEVLAILGGKDYNKSQYNRATLAKRQVGSTMKPFLYYAALESGFTASSSFTSQLTTFKFSNNKTYCPKNYNNKYAEGPISMGTAIAYSDNIYAVKTHLFLGEDMLISIANRLGISSHLEAIPSLALGTEEISIREMVNAYASFANLGYKVNSHFIKKIEDFNGNVLYEYNYDNQHILNESLVYILNEMLTYTYDKDFINYNYPTLISLLPKITHKYSIKTGTTNTDNLIIGYNKEFVLGIWTGYDDNAKMTANDSGIHKDIWIDTVENYFKNKKTDWYNIPNNVIGVLVDPLTGIVATEETKNPKIFYYIKGTEPKNNNNYDLDYVFSENDLIEGE